MIRRPLVYKLWHCKGCSKEFRHYSQAPWWRRLFGYRYGFKDGGRHLASGGGNNPPEPCGPTSYLGEFVRQGRTVVRLGATT